QRNVSTISEASNRSFCLNSLTAIVFAVEMRPDAGRLCSDWPASIGPTRFSVGTPVLCARPSSMERLRWLAPQRHGGRTPSGYDGCHASSAASACVATRMGKTLAAFELDHEDG